MKKIITIPDRVSREMHLLSEEFGFANDTEFIRNAIRDKILELKKLFFMQISTKVSKGLESKGLVEADLLEDFKKFRDKQWKKKKL